VLRQLRYRHKLVKVRTIAKNSVHAIGINAGLPLRGRLLTQTGMEQLQVLPLSPVLSQQRDEWLALIRLMNKQIGAVEESLEQCAKDDEAVELLRTHPGIGLLTSLCLVHTLQPVARFGNTRKVAAYAGFDPMERSSAERKHFLGISKAGSRVLRYLLVEAANIAVRKDEDLKRFYQRLAQRRGRPKAKVAAARKLLIRAYIMMRDEIDYAEFRRRAVAARLARLRQGPQIPAALIGQPASTARQESLPRGK
jgi:transposase